MYAICDGVVSAWLGASAACNGRDHYLAKPVSGDLADGNLNGHPACGIFKGAVHLLQMLLISVAASVYMLALLLCFERHGALPFRGTSLYFYTLYSLSLFPSLLISCRAYACVYSCLVGTIQASLTCTTIPPLLSQVTLENLGQQLSAAARTIVAPLFWARAPWSRGSRSAVATRRRTRGRLRCARASTRVKPTRCGAAGGGARPGADLVRLSSGRVETSPATANQCSFSCGAPAASPQRRVGGVGGGGPPE